MNERDPNELIVTPQLVEDACANPQHAGSNRIHQLINKLDLDMTMIRGQIDVAARKFRDHGIKSDDNWFRSAQKALRIKEVQHDRLSRALDEARNIQQFTRIPVTTHEAYDIRIAFYNAALDILHEEDFQEIMNAAQNKISQREMAQMA